MEAVSCVVSNLFLYPFMHRLKFLHAYLTTIISKIHKALFVFFWKKIQLGYVEKMLINNFLNPFYLHETNITLLVAPKGGGMSN